MIDAQQLAHLRRWIGRQTHDADVAAPRHARLMAATVDRPGPPPAVGDPLPPLWHWLYFLEGQPPGALGRDGHPARGGFLPPVPLPNRMWAGGALAFEATVPIGSPIEKRSTVQAVEHKTGRSGELVFVTVAHEVHAGGRCCIRETQDLVYKAAAPPRGGPPPAPAPAGAHPAAPAPDSAHPPAAAPAGATHTRAWTPDATELFRYSALTFNGHRIHYDADYCRQVEGYADLVVHGPLIATRLAALAAEAIGAPPSRFAYRALRPVLRGTAVTLAARRPSGAADAAGAVSLWAALPDGSLAMRAEAHA